MNWLDEMEAAELAYPNPDADPWSSPGYVPGAAPGLPAVTGDASGERAWQRNARAPRPAVGSRTIPGAAAVARSRQATGRDMAADSPEAG